MDAKPDVQDAIVPDNVDAMQLNDNEDDKQDKSEDRLQEPSQKTDENPEQSPNAMEQAAEMEISAPENVEIGNQDTPLVTAIDENKEREDKILTAYKVNFME